MESFVRGYYQFCLWIMRLFLLNILWIAFTILGLGIFGFMPATAAMFAIVRKWVFSETDIPIYKTFWKKYKQSFKQTNLHGLVFAFVGYLLITEFRIVQVMGDSTAKQMVMFAILGTILLYGLIVLYYFPIYVHFDLESMSYFKWPFVIGIVYPVLSVVLILLLVFGYYFLSYTPILVFLFGGSVGAYIIMWGVSKTFQTFEENNTTIT